MFAEERQQLISALVAERGRVSVTDLADRFSITTETVRRDLAALEVSGNLRRVHGGAVPSDRLSTREESILERAVQRQIEKLRIANAALALIPELTTGSILLDAGSTTEILADLLAQRTPSANGNDELVVITHAIPIAGKLSSTQGIALQILGGRVRGLTQAAVGQSTVEAAYKLRPDIAFVGANGIHSTFGLSTPDPEEAAVKAAFVTSARRVVALADSSKLDAETLVQFATLKDVDTLITDSEPSAELAAALADAGVDVVIA
ncbi:DeoR/GlpR family DNA-binding transcription regulator [Arthrobacter sp. AK01]|uniref:DeoR/GlpR family DNA-binding transcription regulator n=1 Tax=Micrococcaceae TaxID=1268 RepID=UPI001E523285|nr:MULTISPECIES: DeoR/GlpR family DNA-binding transcription regulator [Micrococcaceae]MCD4853689.1 DeoR/GlpR family DNA-binding transcription regulator [Arthrobacter sp. AK01]MCP1411969.1 DeoR family fructose operon transcriptional repressor [Paenarthrobacter sp. A20]